MNQRSITTIILAVSTVIMGQDNYQAQSVLPIHTNPSSNIGIHGSPLGIWKPGGDLPLHGGTRKSDPYDPLLSNPLGSLDLSALGVREAQLRQWLTDSSLSFDSLRAELHPDPHHAGAPIKTPVHPSKPNVHGPIDPAFPHGKTPIIDPLLNGGNIGALVSGGLLPAGGHLSGLNSGGFLGVNIDPRVQQGFVDTISGVGQVFDPLGHTGSHPKPVIKDPVKKDALLGNSHNVIRDPNFVGPLGGAVLGAVNLPHPGKAVPQIIDPILRTGHGVDKISNVAVQGGLVGGIVNDPRRKPTGGFPTGY